MKVHLEARIVGEMKPGDIPLAPGVDLDALLAGDGDPLEIVCVIPPGRSTRGWDYRPEAIQAIVNHVNRHTLNGFLGHQKPEDVDTQFPQPVVHWVGAVWRDGKAYIRGVVDKAAADLKRWLRARRIREVSIFGMPELRSYLGRTEVIGYRPFSIDFAPLGRAGMPTRILLAGEIDSTFAPGGPGGASAGAPRRQFTRPKLVDLETGQSRAAGPEPEPARSMTAPKVVPL